MTTIYRPVERNAPYATGADGERAEFWGFLYGVPGQGTYSFDERLDEDIKLNGGLYWCQGAGIGDTVSFSIIDKSQPQEVVLAEYVQEMPLAPWEHQADLTAPTVASLGVEGTHPEPRHQQVVPELERLYPVGKTAKHWLSICSRASRLSPTIQRRTRLI
jgi:hypothetical protein